MSCPWGFCNNSILIDKNEAYASHALGDIAVLCFDIYIATTIMFAIFFVKIWFQSIYESSPKGIQKCRVREAFQYHTRGLTTFRLSGYECSMPIRYAPCLLAMLYAPKTCSISCENSCR